MFSPTIAHDYNPHTVLARLRLHSFKVHRNGKGRSLYSSQPLNPAIESFAKVGLAS
jgi:hypothetical protein